MPASPGAVSIASVSWDCNEGMMRIAVAAAGGGGGQPASARTEVSVLSPAGTVEATTASTASTADGQAPGIGGGTVVYEAPLPEDTLLLIRASLVVGRVVHTSSETVRTGGQCVGEASFGSGPGAGAPPAGGSGGGTAPDGTLAQEREPEPEQRRDPSPEMAPDGAQPPPESERPEGEKEEKMPPPPESERPEGETPPPPPESERPEGETPPPPQPEQATDGDPDAQGDGQGAEGGSAGGGGGCLIATAAYGTELAPQVQALREVRDGAVLSTGIGSLFMSSFNAAYYAVSPHIADLEREHPAFRDAVRIAIAPALHAVQAVSLAEPGSEAGVAAYGIASILLVGAVYVAAPAAAAAAAARSVRRRRRRGRPSRPPTTPRL